MILVQRCIWKKFFCSVLLDGARALCRVFHCLTVLTNIATKLMSNFNGVRCSLFTSSKTVLGVCDFP